jgi:hypothetical protein
MIFTSNDIPLEELYREIPVDIDTFISDPQYLGASTRNGESIYPFWKETLNKIFNTQDSFKNPMDYIVFNTAIGTGKTRMCVISLLYLMYNFMCLKDPVGYFMLMNDSKLSIIFVAPSLQKAEGTAYRTFLEYIASSPWFCEHGEVKSSIKDGHVWEYIPDVPIRIMIGSHENHVLGTQPIGAYIDRTSSDCNDRYRVSNTAHIIKERIRSRFTKQGVCYGKTFIDNEIDFDDPTLDSKYVDLWYSIRGTNWEVKPRDWFSEETIPIVVNPVIGKSRVIWDNNVVPKLEENEHIIEVPIDFESSIKLVENSPEDFSRMILMQLAGEYQTIYEKNVPFKDAMEAMLDKEMAIRIPGYRESYFIYNNHICHNELGRIDLSPMEFFREFINCDSWEVFPSSFVKIGKW